MSQQWMTHQAGKYKKIPFSKIQFLTFTLTPNLLHRGLVETALRARCNKTCQRKGKFGVKGWYLPTSGGIWYKGQYKNLSLSTCLAANSSFTNPPLLSAFWGPRTSDLSSLPAFSISQPGPRHLSGLHHSCDSSLMSVKRSGDVRDYCWDVWHWFLCTQSATVPKSLSSAGPNWAKRKKLLQLALVQPKKKGRQPIDFYFFTLIWILVVIKAPVLLYMCFHMKLLWNRWGSWSVYPNIIGWKIRT